LARERDLVDEARLLVLFVDFRARDDRFLGVSAAYSFTATFTSPKLIDPDQIARAMRGIYPGSEPPTHCCKADAIAAHVGDRPGGWPHAGFRLSGRGGTCHADDATRTTRSTDDHTS
jgi:hypothetical protein